MITKLHTNMAQVGKYHSRTKLENYSFETELLRLRSLESIVMVVPVHYACIWQFEGSMHCTKRILNNNQYALLSRVAPNILIARGLGLGGLEVYIDV